MTNSVETTDHIWKREEIESPCVKICVLDNDICLGCFRTKDEITAWGHMSPQNRKDIMQQLPERNAQLKPKRRGGRQIRHIIPHSSHS